MPTTVTQPSPSPFPYKDINFNTPLWAITNPRIYVHKSDRKLLLVNDDILVREYRIGLGPFPNGDKFMRGDGRTPEGQFYVCARNPNSKYYKSLGLSYPAPKHAEQAWQAGAISTEQFQCIINANNNRQSPPWDTTLGGAIFIHGGGAHEDWTEGCIAVYNSAIDELFEVIPLGTQVEVMP
jgi:murein L,D-transpeptidase YafK